MHFFRIQMMAAPKAKTWEDIDAWMEFTRASFILSNIQGCGDPNETL